MYLLQEAVNLQNVDNEKQLKSTDYEPGKLLFFFFK